jgi:hypothetical protein
MGDGIKKAMGDGSMALFHILRLNTIAEANPFFSPLGTVATRKASKRRGKWERQNASKERGDG